MQLTIELDDETCATLQSLAEAEQCSPGRIIARALRRLPRRQPPPTVPPHHGYRIPVSQGRIPFTTEDVRRFEDEDDMRGMA
jgi:hypothetical protein